MHKYIIEFGDGKIFSYEMQRGGNYFRWRNMRPHGDLFYSAEKFSAYWQWFTENTGDEIAICFVYAVEEIALAEKIIDAAPKFNCVQNSTWKFSELKKFFSTCHLELTNRNFSWDETTNEITFDGGQKFRLSGTGNFSLTDDTKSRFIVRGCLPAEYKKIPDPDAKNKVTAEDLRGYIAEQTDGQCDTVSFRQ